MLRTVFTSHLFLSLSVFLALSLSSRRACVEHSLRIRAVCMAASRGTTTPPPRGDDGDALQGLRPPHLRQLRQCRRRCFPRHGRRPIET